MALSVALNWVAHREVASWTETIAEDSASWSATEDSEDSATTVTEDSATTVRAPMHVGAGAEWASCWAWLVLVGSTL